ncbi:BEL1-like homeodomain protein 4 [Sesamum indicum]|uniref:BEL1-like homeodomain protein 4 n=1 Tax=Sesamum indicum TaxID=4182 RepID=A0A6I9UDM4_SESIN|nr:BEL1-like homeodomain protein 4 [Sesamum indicum]
MDMGIATPTLLPSVTSHSKGHNSLQYLDKQNFSNSMSQDYHQSIFSFSNGFERSQQEQQQQHIAQQIRRDKLRVQGFQPPVPPLVGIEGEESGELPVYETAGMLSEMFNFPSGVAATATELLENQILQSYRNPRGTPPSGGASTADWFPHRQGMVVGGANLGDSKNQTVVNDTASHPHHQQQQHQISSINADSAAAMQLFLMNPQQQRSPSPSPSHPPPSTSSTLHMLLPNPSSSSTLQAFQNPSAGAFGQFTWVPNSGNENNPNEIPGVVEGQGLSLSLSSSLQHLEAAKAEELRMGEGGMLFFGQGGGSTPPQYQFKNFGGSGGGALHLQGGGVSHNHQLHVGLGSSLGTVNMLRNSKYAKAAQELLEEFCSVGRGQFKKNKFGKQNNNNGNPSSNPSAGATSGGGAGGGNSSSSSKDNPPLSAADRLEHQRRKVKLLSMLDEVDRRYNHYCEQMQMVVNSFDMVMGFGAAVPYTCLAQKAMSRHFRCLKDAIAAQLKHSCELLGEKDAGTSGVTKGETPRLRILEQSLRQQRAFHQMGMMDQEAWRPQRGLPERSVNILRAWLFEHFLHPYPSDADKHLLARQTGLSRNQVSNWFINARVRLWKPMVEEMYQQEAKDEAASTEQDRDQSSTSAQTPTLNANPPATTTTTATSATAITPSPAKRSEINAPENDPSFVAINNNQCFSDNQPKLHHHSTANVSLPPAPAVAQSFSVVHPSNDGIHESTLIRFGTNAGDVSLTLGLRHAGNLPEKSPFSVRDFGGC